MDPLQQDEVVRRRLIDLITSPEDENQYTSVGFIIWYCFLVLCCGLPCLACMVACIIVRLRQADSSELNQFASQEELNDEIARMEANIQAFAEVEKQRKKLVLLNSLHNQKFTIDSNHLASKNHSSESSSDDDRDVDPTSWTKSNEPSTTNPWSSHHALATPRWPPTRHITSMVALHPSRLKSGCSICLTKYIPGDVAVYSSNPSCQHVFHHDCIISWLVTRQAHLCPCCRQPFIDDEDRLGFSVERSAADANADTNDVVGQAPENVAPQTTTSPVRAAEPASRLDDDELGTPTRVEEDEMDPRLEEHDINDGAESYSSDV